MFDSEKGWKKMVSNWLAGTLKMGRSLEKMPGNYTVYLYLFTRERYLKE